MQKRNLRTDWSTFTVVSLGLLVAAQIILTRLLAVNIGGFGRITFGPVAIIMAGLWFGPAAGALTGLTADLLGCLIQGYAVNPLITLAAVCWGVVPSFFKPSSRIKNARRMAVLAAGILLTGVLSTLLFNTMGLVLILGYNFYAIMPTRLIQFAVIIPMYIVVTILLYFSPVTDIVRQSARPRKTV
jgi:ECF transporter S component (folate family)